MENNKESKNLLKFSKRFYFQTLIFIIVACVHFYIASMFKIESFYYSDEFLADPIRSIIGLALLLPGGFLNSFIFNILETTHIHLVSSILYGVLGAFLISEKLYLRVISVILVIFFAWYAYVAFGLIAMGD
jgi:hypothetical protein